MLLPSSIARQSTLQHDLAGKCDTLLGRKTWHFALNGVDAVTLALICVVNE